MAIHQWPKNEQPRQRLLTLGAKALSDAELLAIFLRTGIKGQSAVDLARSLLAEHGSLVALLDADMEKFCQSRGLGEAKYVQLQAVLEMAGRYVNEQMQQQPAFCDAASAKQFLSLQLRSLQQEVFAVLFLNSQHQLIQFEILFYGSINQAAVYPREIIKKALQYHAQALILSHNHPSQVAEPSDADKQITQHIKQAAELMDIRVLDHLLVAGHTVYSFAENGLM